MAWLALKVRSLRPFYMYHILWQHIDITVLREATLFVLFLYLRLRFPGDGTFIVTPVRSYKLLLRWQRPSTGS